MMQIQWADRVKGMENAAVKEILKIAQRSDVISFAGGLPSAQAFPVKELADAFQATFAEQGAAALQYGMTEGYEPLRQWVADRLQHQGITCSSKNVIITNGSQQVLDLVCRILVNPGETIVVENPTYLAALQVFNGGQAKLIPVLVDEFGMDIEALAQILQTEQPKLIYVNPTFQNPTGVTMPLARRQRLAELASQYRVPVLEDNPYGELRFDGEHLPPVKSMPGGEWVLYAGTISKIVAPGLRIGWMVASEEFIEKMASAKQLSDVLTNSLTQRALYRYLSDNNVEKHIQTIVAQYREQRDVMLESMKEYFPASVSWIVPDGGMFIWAKLPEHVDTNELLPKAVENKVAFVPGAPFYANGTGHNTMRLNFSNSTPDLIRSGIERLGILLKQYV